MMIPIIFDHLSNVTYYDLVPLDLSEQNQNRSFGTTYRLSSSYMERVKFASVIGIVLLEMVTQILHFFI
jgi:hypothetical protein